ncbi:MAG: DUF3095 domain-containing protein [Rhodothermaceae bacterium]|nr:DUF3095 domain-containing protein [Rhodothermaceae bacterium]
MSASFYDDLPSTDHFESLADAEAYTEVPPDWRIVITDVEGSTAAVAAGRYREVNYAGPASIAALLNAAGDIAIPFVFGGDGATVLIPSALEETVVLVLRTVQQVCREDLGLILRAGMVPVQDVLDHGGHVAVLKHTVSPDYDQAMFMGGGLLIAETLVKDPATAERYDVGEGPMWDDSARDLYQGLECRWEEIPSPQGEVTALLVLAQGPTEAAHFATYRAVLHAVEATFGAAERVHPVGLGQMRLARSPARLDLEAAVRAPRHQRAAYRWTLWLQTLIGRPLIALGLKTKETDWAAYPRKLRAFSDYRKFDDTLRMVLSGSATQREALTVFLQDQREAGRLAYGLHVSDRATLTCLVFSRMGRQVHFVDGADGGYTAAARQLKAQLAEAT